MALAQIEPVTGGACEKTKTVKKREEALRERFTATAEWAYWPLTGAGRSECPSISG